MELLERGSVLAKQVLSSTSGEKPLGQAATVLETVVVAENAPSDALCHSGLRVFIKLRMGIKIHPR
jgi:hypothetical protein